MNQFKLPPIPVQTRQISRSMFSSCGTSESKIKYHLNVFNVFKEIFVTVYSHTSTVRLHNATYVGREKFVSLFACSLTESKHIEGFHVDTKGRIETIYIFN